MRCCQRQGDPPLSHASGRTQSIRSGRREAAALRRADPYLNLRRAPTRIASGRGRRAAAPGRRRSPVIANNLKGRQTK
jgi:hypothetical protein